MTETTNTNPRALQAWITVSRINGLQAEIDYWEHIAAQLDDPRLAPAIDLLVGPTGFKMFSAAVQSVLDRLLRTVATKIADVIERGAWRTFVTPTGREVINASFAQFIVRAQPEGLGTDITTIRCICRGTPWAEELLDQVLDQEPAL